MKTLFKILALALLANAPLYAQQNVEKMEGQRMKADITLGTFTLSTYLKVIPENNDEVIIESPRNADKVIFSGLKPMLARLSGKIPHHGIFLSIKAKRVSDSLIGSARMLLVGTVAFRGKISRNSLSGNFIKDNTPIATLKGHSTTEQKNDYRALYQQIMDITQKNIYSKDVLQTAAWKDFDKKFKSLTTKATDDIELYLGFSIYSRKLPFSHYFLYFEAQQSPIDTGTQPNVKNVIFEEKDGAAYINIKNFSTTQQEIAEIFPHIIDKHYKYLIIDLRDNPGGGLEASLALARYILRDSVSIGYFVSNKFPADNGFNEASFSRLPVSHATTTNALIEELKTSAGARFVAPKPAGKAFEGKIYVLTNNNTASTCEPLVYVLKTSKMATVVGENTAGKMLSGAFFPIDSKYQLFLPIADFYTYDGKRLEGNGVPPDIAVKSEAALDTTLSLIRVDRRQKVD